MRKKITLDMPGHAYQIWQYQLVGIFIFTCMKKDNLIPHFFPAILYFKETYNFIG